MNCERRPGANLRGSLIDGGLGRTEDVVAVVLGERHWAGGAVRDHGQPDEVVRLRVGDALEKVCRKQPGWFVSHVERILGDLGGIGQPSVQWHVAQMLQHLRGCLTEDQAGRATRLLQQNLASSTDWIVLNVTMDVLTDWAHHDPLLTGWLTPELERLRQDHRSSVAKRAAQRLAELAE